MEKFTCECGHKNPRGTIVCESCGKPLDNEDTSKLLDMKYEGSAIRSKTYKKSMVDKIWNFFSSVKVGIWIIILILLASALGTVFPQEMYIPPNVAPSIYYADEYGIFGELYYELGFHNLFGTWWYMLLLAALGASLIISSLDRFVPLYRSLKNQRVTRHDHFMKRQRIFGITKTDNPDEQIEKAKERLKNKRYNVREENGNLLAEKARFSRWGPYVNHTGIIIFLIGAMLRFFPGMYVDEVLWLREGETKAIPGTSKEYYLENNEFILDVYGDDEEDEQYQAAIENAGLVPKNFQTDATLYKREGEVIAGAKPTLEKIKDYPIRVNEPLNVDGYSVYQVDYRLNELSTMTFALENKQTKEKLGQFTVNLLDPKENYEVQDGYKVEVIDYFPDFEFDDKGEPSTISKVPNNPAFIFKMFTPETPEGEVSFVAIRQNLEPLGENDFKISFEDIETTNATALSIKKDKTVWILAVGAAIFMIGLIQGMYWHHRRIWIRRKDGEIWLAAHTNKGWFGLKSEIESITNQSDLLMPIDQVEEKTKS